MKHFIVATAGHVDHGKSTLVKALTGTDPDRLPEEKARGMTIDLGFAELTLGEFNLGIVDVPGHDAFVRNMIAGVGSIDIALFVVAADDGWMPQTEEHFQILSYLGIKHAIVALTKIDIGDAIRVEADIRVRLRDTPFADCPIVHVFTRTEHGVEELKRALAAELSRMEPPRDIGKSRLFVDRAFKLRGIGTVITGTLTGGKLRVGETIAIQPRNLSARIRSLQTHRKDVDLAEPGMRVAINLPELELEKEIQRGDVVTGIGFETFSNPDVVIERSNRSNERPLKNRSQVYLHYGTERVRAKVLLLDQAALRRGERGIAQLVLDKPIVAFLGDRFVLRDPSEKFTIGGGTFLDPAGNRDAKLLRARASAPENVDLCLQTELERDGAVPLSSLLRHSHFSANEVSEAVQRLGIDLRGDLAIDPTKWNGIRERAAGLIDDAHRQSPDRRGLELSELRSAFPTERPELIEALINDLDANEFVRTKSTIARRSHRAALPPELGDSAQGILQQFSAKPFDPSSRKQIAPDSKTQQILRFLIEHGEVIEIGPDGILSSEGFEQMKARVVAFISKNGAATVSQLRQELQTSRRIVIPFLERLDRDGVTRRLGDQRKLADEIVSRALK